ncbi:MAG: BatA domain-containing protein [Ignavibacteriae bacterium]|nr:BatA domain-containing protein [Ignavibacteriota bacterium]
MVFLNPAILLGLLAATIPILIHLLNFRKLKKVEFSSLTFLKELQKSKIKKIKIKQWLLLFLRTLLIILLVLAFARPTLEGTNIIGSASSAKSSNVFVLDNSISMSYLNDKGTIFNQSKKIIKEIINKIDDGSDFYFITIADSVKSTTNKTNALQILDGLKLTQVSKPFDKIILSAKDILIKSQNLNKEIFIFSDFQKSTFSTKIDSLKNSIDENIRVFSFNLAEENPENYSVSNLRLNNSIIEVNKPLNFTVDVSNNSQNQTDDLAVSLFINNERVAQQNISLQANQIKSIDFETILNSPGLIETKVELEEDNIIEDNICFLNFEVLEKIKILLLYDSIDDIRFLNSAINSVTTSDRFEVTQKPANKISFLSLNNFDIIFLVTSGNIEPNLISNYLTSGGNVVFFPNSNPELNKLNEFLKKLNLPSAQKIISTDNTNLNFAEYGKIDFTHPLFQSLFPDKNKQQIESPNIFKYLKFTEQQTIKSIIRLNDNNLFMGETNYNSGKIIFFNSSPNFQSGNFPIKSIFAPLITRVILYLTTNQNDKIFNTGSEIQLDIKKYNFPIIDITTPNGNEKINIQDIYLDKYNFSGTDFSGSYKFYSNNKLIDFASVNLIPAESDLRKIEIDTLNNFYTKHFGENYSLINPNENYLDKIKNARFGTELWKLFLLLAFLTALIEMFVARSSQKDLMNLTEN